MSDLWELELQQLCVVQYGCSELHMGPLQEQHMVLVTEPFPQLLINYIKLFCVCVWGGNVCAMSLYR